MIWDYTLTLTGKSLLPVGTLNHPDLAIEVTIPNQPQTWNKAGYLYPLINVGGGDIPAQPVLILLGAQVIQIPYSAYKLRFVPVPYLGSPYTFKLFKIPMSISPTSYNPPTLGADVTTSINASLTNVVLSAPNPLRAEGFIINKSNRTLWLNFAGVAATAAFPNIAVAPGFNIDIPQGYGGAINGIWVGTTPTLTAEIHEFSYV